MPRTQLSKADSRVLAQVFDPESGPAAAEVIVNPELLADRHINDRTLLGELKGREKTAISFIEAYETSSDQTQEVAYARAIEILDQIVSVYPNYASAKNNRAQLRRWRFGDRNLLCQSHSSRDTERSKAATTAVQDLKDAIRLSSPDQPHGAVSPSQGKLLAQAYTQLGALCHAAAKDLVADNASIVVSEYSAWSKDMLEEEASRLFYLGGLYGNQVAKALAVQTNPHAKLCGSIVKEAMRKELAQIGA